MSKNIIIAIIVAVIGVGGVTVGVIIGANGGETMNGGGAGTSPEVVVEDLNKFVEIYTAQEGYDVLNNGFQKYLATYASNYKLLDNKTEPFTVRPTAPEDLFSYGTARDGVCADTSDLQWVDKKYQKVYDVVKKYMLIYSENGDKYYSVKFECADEEDHEKPHFLEAVEL